MVLLEIERDFEGEVPSHSIYNIYNIGCSLVHCEEGYSDASDENKLVRNFML